MQHGGRPSIHQNGAPKKPPQQATMKVSAQRVAGTGLPRIPSATPAPQDSRQLEELKARVEQLTVELANSLGAHRAASETAAAESSRANSLAKKLLSEEQCADKARKLSEAAQSEARCLQEQVNAMAGQLTLLTVQNEGLKKAAADLECEECHRAQVEHATRTADMEGAIKKLRDELAERTRSQNETEMALQQMKEAAAAEPRSSDGISQSLEDAVAEAKTSASESVADALASAASAEREVEELRAALVMFRRNHDEANETANETLRACEAKLRASESSVAELSIQLEIEKEHVADAAELSLLRDKIRRQESMMETRDRAHAAEVLALEKRAAVAERTLHKSEEMVSTLESELRSSLASTDVVGENLWAKCQQQLETQFGDDSYEAVLLEELSEMRERFSQKIEKLVQQCADAERAKKVGERLAGERFAQEKASLESRCLALGTRLVSHEAEIERLRNPPNSIML